MLSTSSFILFAAMALCVAAVVRLLWEAGTVSAFAAGAAAGAVVSVDPDLLLVVAIVVGAISLGGVFAARTRGQLTDEKEHTRWTSRLGALWLVLSFPAIAAWSSLQATHWMLHRV